MLNSAVRFKSFYRVAYFLPNVTSVVAIAIVFGSIFSTNFGLVNAVLHGVGIDQVAWLNTPWGIKVAIATLMTWQWTGYNAIIFLAGLQTIPGELYEAARIDGARSGADLLPDHAAAAAADAPVRARRLDGHAACRASPSRRCCSADVVQRLDVPGGPGHAGLTMVLYFYQQTFDNNDFGYGAAVGVGASSSSSCSSRSSTGAWCGAGAN